MCPPGSPTGTGLQVAASEPELRKAGPQKTKWGPRQLHASFLAQWAPDNHRGDHMTSSSTQCSYHFPSTYSEQIGGNLPQDGSGGTFTNQNHPALAP